MSADDKPKRRVRFDLSEPDAYMDVCLSPDASPETIAALRALGEATLDHMRRMNDPLCIEPDPS